MNSEFLLGESLINKYTNGFMYVDYPHKSVWKQDFNEADYRAALKRLFVSQNERPVKLYVHIPFCEKLCFYCLCHRVITRDYEKVKAYMQVLYKEIAMLKAFFDEHGIKPNFREIHLGGGSPTILRTPEFDELIDNLSSIIDFSLIDEFSIEIDPRSVKDDLDRVKHYHKRGVTRISIGVQDFDPVVQKTINRVQPRELIDALLTPDIREKFESVNFDVLVGLPMQTKESFRKTIETVIEMAPDRIDLAYFNFAPRNQPHMKVLENANRPDDITRHELFMEATQKLVESGYVRIGFDHFALETDRQAKAMTSKKLKWNSLGYSPGSCNDMLGIGLGSSSVISDEYYSQNLYEQDLYSESIGKGKFPVFRGYKLTDEDILRRDIIQQLRSYYHIDFTEVGKKYQIDFRKYFSGELKVLQEFTRDGIVALSPDEVKITEVGKHFCNIVCRVFDGYNRGDGFPDNFFEVNRTAGFGITSPKVGK